MYEGSYGAPFYYDYINQHVSKDKPSVVHTNSVVKRFWMKYLLEKAMSVYEFENIPEDWDMSYLLYVLFCFGFFTVFRTRNYGIVAQHCQLSGRGIFYQPTRAIVTNPILGGGASYNLKINEECSLIKLQPNYSGIMDIVDYYSDMLALSSESASINLVNTKLAYVYMADGKAEAESFKKMHDKIASGEPAVFIDKKLFDEEGNPRWLNFNQNLKQTYIAGDILLDMAKWLDMYNTEIGIPNANTEKRERLIDSEVNANNIDTMSNATIRLESIRSGLDRANEMFGLDMGVKFRFNEELNSNFLEVEEDVL